MGVSGRGCFAVSLSCLEIMGCAIRFCSCYENAVSYLDFGLDVKLILGSEFRMSPAGFSREQSKLKLVISRISTDP